MSAGAASVAPRPCSRAGCCKPVQARGLCPAHYKQWRNDNPGTRLQLTTQNAVFDALPGKPAEIQAATGLCREAVLRALDILHAQDRAHIGDHYPPTTTGTRFEPVWVEGAGKHHRVSAKEKNAQRRLSERQAYARRKRGFAAALGVSA